MPIISIIEQPATNSLKAAYRPIVFVVRASRTDGNAQPPIVYCDIYVDGIFYKSQERTIYKTLNATNSDWQFDIMDAVQEILSSTIQQNGGTAIIKDSMAMRSIYCKFRSSGYDTNGFITPQGTAPVQGTGSVAPVAGTGTQSNTFFGIISTLQHEQNQNVSAHLGYYKTGTWDANVFPLTHRKAGYKVCRGDSDYFPIVNLSTKDPLCLKLFYKNKGDSSYSSVSKCGEASCVAVSVASFSFADAVVGVAYSKSVPISGTGPFTKASFSSPATWLSCDVVGSDLVFSGTPAAGDIGTSIPVNFQISNACGTASGYKTIDVVDSCVPVDIAEMTPFPDAYTGQLYDKVVIFNGTAPYSLTSVTMPSWMTYEINDNAAVFSGTPTEDDIATNIEISFTVNNDCGSKPFADTIDVIQSGTRFDGIIDGGGDTWNHSETALITGGDAGATITITLETFTNTNGGALKINGFQIFSTGYTFNVVLDGSGNSSFVASIQGYEHPSTVINATFSITGVTSGTIGNPESYQISKVF